MNRGRTQLLVVLLALIVAGIVYVLSTSGTPPVVDPIAEPGTPTTETAPPNDSDPVAKVESGTQRIETKVDAAPRPGSDPRLDDPEIRAALTGFTGRVVDEQVAPCAERRVQLWRVEMTSMMDSLARLPDPPTPPEFLAGEVKTGDDGRFSIPGVWPGGIYLIVADAGGETPTFQLVEQVPSPGQTVDLGDIMLRRGATLTGFVADDDGKPLGGALVRATDLPAMAFALVPLERIDPRGAAVIRDRPPEVVVEFPSWGVRIFESLPIPTTRTGADGRFRLTGIEPALVTLAVTAPKFTSHVKSGLKLGAGETRDLGTIRMSVGESAVGRVVDSNGKPVAGAELLVAQASAAAPVDFAVRAGTTDADGRFEWSGIAGGKVTVAARRDATMGWVVAAGKSVAEDVVLTLPARCKLTVDVVDEKDVRFSKPSVQVFGAMPQDGLMPLHAFGLTTPIDVSARSRITDEGKFVVDGLEIGSYMLAVTAPGAQTKTTRVDLTADAETKVTLRALATFAVLVTDETGKPIRNATVLGAGPGMERDFPLRCGLTAADGRVTVTRFPAGEVRLVVTHPKYGGTSAQANTEVAEKKVVLATPGSVECVVTEDGRTPAPGKWMVAVVRSGGGMRAPMEMPRLVTPSLDGRFVVEALQPGTYTFQSVESMRALRSPGGFYSAAGMTFMFGEKGSVRCEVVAGRRESLRLEVNPAAQPIEGPSGTLAGTVTIDGRPAVGYYAMSFIRTRKSVVTDANGRFDFGTVPIGTWHVQLFAPNAMEGRAALWTGRIEVKPGEAKFVTLDFEMGAIAGVVVAPDGAPAAGIRVDVTGNPRQIDGVAAGSLQQFHAVTDANGRYAIDSLPVGVYTLSAHSRGVGKTTIQDVKLEVGSRANVDVRLVRGFTLRARVDLQAFGTRKFRSGSMAVLDEANQENEWVRLEADGTFEVQNLKGGAYKLMPSFRFDERGEPGSWAIAESPITVHADRLDVVVRPVFTPTGITGPGTRIRDR